MLNAIMRRFSAVCLMMLAFAVIAEAQVCTPAPVGLTSWWSADGNALDARSRNNGTLQNGATIGAGQVGQAFSFDGVNDLVEVPFSSALNVNAVTIEGWVKTTSTVTPDHKLISGRPGNYQLAKLDDGRLAFAVVIGGNFINAFSIATLPANTLTHLVGTYDAATGLVKVYINGNLEGTTTTSGTPDVGSQPFEIGGFLAFGNHFAGVIDEVSLYNRALVRIGNSVDIYRRDRRQMQTNRDCRPDRTRRLVGGGRKCD